MIIGITGYYASGKDTVAEYLIKKGFEHYSLSDEIRAECKRKNIKDSRDNMIKLANELRERFGPSLLAERIRNRLRENKDYVITSIRNPAEVKSLQEENKFVLVSVVADRKKRFELLKDRARESDPITFKEFVEKEKIEESSDPNKQQLDKVHKLSKIIVKNDQGLDQLYEKVDKLIIDLRKKYHVRPTWDEYFMGIVNAISKRATCDRGRTGCVIVKEKQILATGYVGSPVGLEHCDEVGHQFKKTYHEDGSVTQHCVRTIHAEQNALCQAAKRGIALDGATLYCKLEPCFVCAKMLINAGIKRIVCQIRYHAGKDTRELFAKAGIRLEALSEKVEQYGKQ
jgi:dCMP deaminase